MSKMFGLIIRPTGDGAFQVFNVPKLDGWRTGKIVNNPWRMKKMLVPSKQEFRFSRRFDGIELSPTPNPLFGIAKLEVVECRTVDYISSDMETQHIACSYPKVVVKPVVEG